MTQLALIPPVSMLNYTMLTSYQLVLPHLMVQYPKYHEHYTALAGLTRGGHYIMLDNGEAEGENTFEPEHLYGMAAHLGFNEVIAKDVMGDMSGTFDMTKEFIERITIPRIHAGKVKIGVVLQGQSMDEIMSIAGNLLEAYSDVIHTLHIPRHLIETLGSTRARIDVTKFLDSLYDLRNRKIAVHFLGAHHHAPVEAMHLAEQLPWVRGMDTSMPFNYAFAGASVGMGHHKRPENYFDLTIEDLGDRPALARLNVEQMIKWVYRINKREE